MRLPALLTAICLSAPQAQPTFRSGVELIEVTVVARDRDGRPVTDLSQADFQVIEEGHPQKIVAFERISLPRLRASLESTAVDTSAPRDVSSNEGLAASRVFVIVLDALHVAPQRTRAVREHARRFVERHVGPADLTAVFSPGGLSGATQDFTSDKARLIAAIQQFAGGKLKSATVERDEERRRGEVMLHGGMDPSDFERSNRAQSLTGVLEVVATHLNRVERRRKSLLLFSEGIDYDVSDVLGKVQRQASDVMHAMDRAVAALMRTNVSLYTIDPRGLSSVEGDLVESPLYRPQPDFTQQSVEAEYAASVRGLRELAESTGGFAAVDTNDATPAFDRIVEDSSEYYVVGYTPSHPPKPGQFRAITVRVARPGVRVAARKGYVIPAARRVAVGAAPVDVALPPGISGRARAPLVRTPVESPAPSVATATPDDLRSLLASPLPDAGLPIRVQAIPFKGDRGKGIVQLVVEVLGAGLAFTERGGRFEERVEIALLTVNERARAANGRTTTIELRLTPEERQRVAGTGIRWLSRLDLPPGRHQVRVAARSARTGATGLVAHDITVPEFESGRLGLSGVTMTSLPSVLMITRGDRWLQKALETPPSAARTFVVGDAITVGVQVYVPESAAAGAEVLMQVERPDGPAVTTMARKIPRGKHPERAEDVAFPIDTRPLAPGRYVLRVMASSADGPERVTRSVPFELVSLRR